MVEGIPDENTSTPFTVAEKKGINAMRDALHALIIALRDHVGESSPLSKEKAKELIDQLWQVPKKETL